MYLLVHIIHKTKLMKGRNESREYPVGPCSKKNSMKLTEATAPASSAKKSRENIKPWSNSQPETKGPEKGAGVRFIQVIRWVGRQANTASLDNRAW